MIGQLWGCRGGGAPLCPGSGQQELRQQPRGTGVAGRVPQHVYRDHILSPSWASASPAPTAGPGGRSPPPGRLGAQLSPSPGPVVGSLPLRWSLSGGSNEPGPLSFTPPQRRGRTVFPQHPGLLLLVAAPAEMPQVTLQESANSFFHHFEFSGAELQPARGLDPSVGVSLGETLKPACLGAAGPWLWVLICHRIAQMRSGCAPTCHRLQPGHRDT